MSDRIVTDEYQRGGNGFRLLREATAEICDTDTPASEDEFCLTTTTNALGNALLVDARYAAAIRFDRTPRHVAAGGLDHFQISLCVNGPGEFSSGRRTALMRPGDLCLMDMAQASRTLIATNNHGEASRVLTLVVPRSLLAPMLASPDAATASILSRDSVQGRFLAAQMTALCDGKAGHARAAVVEAAASLIADAIGRANDAETAVDRANRHLLLAAIKRHIDLNLQTEMASVEHICRRFRLSRATLYRLFEPEGGFYVYVHDQRLHRAFHRLASFSADRPRVMDIALDSHFSSDTTFGRAFRRRYGLTPGEVRQLAKIGAEDRLSISPELRAALLMFRELV